MHARRVQLLLLAGLVPLLAYLALGDEPWTLPGGPGFVAERGASLFVTAKIAIWWTSAVNALLLLALIATAGRWTRADAAAPAAAPRARGFLLALLAIAVLAGGLRAPLWGSGLFWDEGWTLRRAVLGGYEREPASGELVFEAVPWRKTLWTYLKPTNHILQSVAARVTNDAWRALTGRGQDAFDERVLRLPSLLAACLAVVLLGLAVRDWGWPRAALLAAFLLAVHPWHVRYGPAMRGYSFVVMGAAASLWTLGRVLATARWRWLAAWAASQVFMIWSHPFSFYLTVSLGGTALVWMGLRGRLRLAARFFVATLLAGMFLLQVMGPALAQVPLWREVHKIEQGAKVRPGALRDLWTQTAAGVPRRLREEAPDVPFPSLETGPALRRGVLWGALPALLAIGLAVGLRRPGAHRPALVGLALGVPTSVAGALLQGHSFYDRFAIWGMLATCALFAIGWEVLVRAVARGRRGPALVGLGAGALLFVALVWPQLRVVLERPHAGMRETVAWLHAAPGSDRALAAGVGLGGDNAKVYDPTLLYLETRAELEALIADAEARGVPLHVFYGYESHNRTRWPDAMALLDDRARFEPMAVFPGVEPEFTYRVFRYRGSG